MTTKSQYAKLALLEGAALEWEPLVPLDAGARPPFPADAFPLYLRQYVAGLAEATQTPADLAGCYVLGSFAGAVARKVVLEPWDGYHEPLCLYLMAIAKSGERKSTLCEQVAAPWLAFEQEEIARAGPELARAASNQNVLRKEADRFEREAANAKTGAEREQARQKAAKVAEELAALPPAVPPQYRTEDCTPEKLKGLLAEQGGRICVLSAEGELLDVAQGRYTANGAASFDALLKGHSGDALLVDRKGQPRVFVERPAITLALAVQPNVVESLFQNPQFRGRGLVARFLYAWPASRLGSRVVGRPMPPEVVSTYANAVTRLLRWPMPEAPYVLRLDADALALGLAWCREVEPQLADTGPLGHLSDVGSKLQGAVFRLMGVLHLAEHVTHADPVRGENLPPVARHTAEGAVRLAAYFLAHAKIACGYGGADPVTAGARRVVEWIRAHGAASFVEREAYKSLNFEKMADLRPCLELLTDFHYIRAREAPPRSGAGRPPSPIWDVNPAVFEPVPVPAVDPEGAAQ